MLPEVYARWRQRTSESGRLPRGYKKSSCDEKVRNAAISLIKAIPDDKQSPAYRIISEFVEQTPLDNIGLSFDVIGERCQGSKGE